MTLKLQFPMCTGISKNGAYFEPPLCRRIFRLDLRLVCRKLSNVLSAVQYIGVLVIYWYRNLFNFVFDVQLERRGE